MVFSFSEYTIKSIRGLKCYLEKQFQPTELRRSKHGVAAG